MDVLISEELCNTKEGNVTNLLITKFTALSVTRLFIRISCDASVI